MTQSIIGSGPYVFLSYLSSDRGKVLKIARELERVGVRVWIDMLCIPAGANYGLAIAEGIQHSAAVLVACSPGALQSRNVKQEIQLAWKHQRPYLPLLLEPTVFPQELEYWLEGYQWVEILDHPEEDWIPRVVHALKKLGIPTTFSGGEPTRAEAPPSAPVEVVPPPVELTPSPPPSPSPPPVVMAPPAGALAPVGAELTKKQVDWPMALGAAFLVVVVAAALIILAPWRAPSSTTSIPSGDGIGGSAPSNSVTGPSSGSAPIAPGAPGAAGSAPGAGGSVPAAPASVTSAPATIAPPTIAPPSVAPTNPTIAVPMMPMGS